MNELKALFLALSSRFFFPPFAGETFHICRRARESWNLDRSIYRGRIQAVEFHHTTTGRTTPLPARSCTSLSDSSRLLPCSSNTKMGTLTIQTGKKHHSSIPTRPLSHAGPRLSPLVIYGSLTSSPVEPLNKRMFRSISGAWRSVTSSDQNVNELLPELFYNPELFRNRNRLPLGKTQDGTVIGKNTH